MNDSQIARKIIEDNVYAVISSASLNGSPWISPVFFAYDEHYNIYWISNKNARHSQLVRENPEAAFVIFNSQVEEGKGEAVYMRARVTELSEEADINIGVQVFNKRVTKGEFKVKDISEVQKEGAWRIYRATPYETTKLSRGKHINGQYIDTRVHVSLS